MDAPQASRPGEPDLLASARTGDAAAFDQLVARYRAELTVQDTVDLWSRWPAETVTSADV